MRAPSLRTCARHAWWAGGLEWTPVWRARVQVRIGYVSGETDGQLVLADTRRGFRCVRGAVTRGSVAVVTTGVAHLFASEDGPATGSHLCRPSLLGAILARSRGSLEEVGLDPGLAGLRHPLLKTGVWVRCVIGTVCLMSREQKSLASYSQMVKQAETRTLSKGFLFCIDLNWRSSDCHLNTQGDLPAH